MIPVHDPERGVSSSPNTPGLKGCCAAAGLQLILTVIALAGFVLAILTGLSGTPVGSRNFGIVFVWIAWWAILMLIGVPLLRARLVQHLPHPGAGRVAAAWGAAYSRGGKRAGPGQALAQAPAQHLAAERVFRLGGVLQHRGAHPARLTGIVLAAFLFIALGASLVFERRSFCRYLCPVGGFIGLYSQVAPLELRVKDTAVCAAHTEKSCYYREEQGYGCPWQVFPGGLGKNTYCGTCMECLRTCTEDNNLVQLRPFGADLGVPSGRKLDEAYKAFIMLGSALIYMAVMLGPWGFLKNAAYSVGSLAGLAYAAAFLAFVLVGLPGLFLLAVLAGRRLAGLRTPLKRLFIAFAYCLVPLGLAAWIAFSLSFVLANLSYLLPVLSDPFGWGWDLLRHRRRCLDALSVRRHPHAAGAGTAGRLGRLGCWWSGVSPARARPARQRSRLSVPVSLFCLGVTLSLMVLLVG